MTGVALSARECDGQVLVAPGGEPDASAAGAPPVSPCSPRIASRTALTKTTSRCMSPGASSCCVRLSCTRTARARPAAGFVREVPECTTRLAWHWGQP